MRHHVRVSLLFSSLLLTIGGCGEPDLRFPGKNLILISVDTLRADALGAWGESRPTSPELDRFASRSVRFARAISPSCVTAPSHMSLLTSLYPSVHRVDNWSFITDRRGRNKVARRKLKSGVPTLASVLQRSGYFTAAFVGGGNLAQEMGFDQGFEVFDDEPENGMNGNREILFDPSRALGWIEEHREGPFFAFLHTYIPHGPYLPPDPWPQKFVRGYSGEIPSDRAAFYADSSSDYQARAAAYWNAVDPEDPEDVAHLQTMYAADVRYADASLETLFSRFDELGLFEDSIVVVVSDHGEEFQEHGSFEHQKKLYDELVHVPFLLRLPDGEKGGTVIEDEVSLMDMMPTLLELLSLPRPESVQGESLAPRISGAPGTGRPAISEKILEWKVEAADGKPIWNPSRILRSVRDERFSFIESVFEADSQAELYDRSSDPRETKNLSKDPDHQDTVKRFRAILDRHGSLCDALAETVAGSETASLRASTVEQLKALGYMREDPAEKKNHAEKDAKPKGN